MADSKYIGRMTTVTLDHVEIAKGATARGPVSFKIGDWLAQSPTPNFGEEWMAFLESRDGALWLVAGANGLLKVGDNDQLLYDGVAPYPLSRPQFIRLVREESREN